MTAAFELSNVGYEYENGVVALRNVSLSIQHGEKIAILGANGSGKSTLIRILDGLIHPWSGTIFALGSPLTAATLASEGFAYSFRRRVGFIFQNSDAQLFSPTVREEIAFGPLQLGLERAEIEQRIEDLGALLGIDHIMHRAPFQLSGGEKKRVAIACTLAINPDILLLDEPSLGLDPRAQYWLIELLVRLHEAGKTLITATHDLNIVSTIADRAIVFSENHSIVADGPAAEILADLPLLMSVNLIHQHLHRHDGLFHTHPHEHGHEHHHADSSDASGCEAIPAGTSSPTG
jgi:cobalt/nickel transport system ATP-binding protein